MNEAGSLVAITPTVNAEQRVFQAPEQVPLKDNEWWGKRIRERSHSTPKSHNIDASFKRRARLLITNSSIPRQTRSPIRYALEIKDPYLAQLVRRVEGGELIVGCLYLE